MEAASVPDSGGQAAAGAEGGEQGQAGGFDPAPVLESVQKLGETFESRMAQLEQSMVPQGFDPNADPYGQQQPGQQPFNQPGQMPGQQDPAGHYDQYGQLTPEGAQAQLQAMMQPHLNPLQQQNQQLAAQLQGLQQTMESLEMDRGAERLEQKYPQLAEEEKANALVQSAMPYAQQFGQPDLVGRAGFLELVHLAELGKTAAAAETPAGPGPELEPGGGASLAGSEPEIQQSIKNAGSGGNRIFRF